MQLTSLSFLFLFLPVCLLVFLLTPVRLRPALLLLISLGYYLLAEPYSASVMVLCVLMDFLSLQIMERFSGSARIRRACMLFSVVKNLIVIGYTAALAEVGSIAPFLGTMVYTLAGIDCVTSVYCREIPGEPNILRFSLYCCFFPRLYAGPLLAYRDFAPQLAALRPTPRMLLDGFGRVFSGSVKLLLFAGYLNSLYDTLSSFAGDEISVVSSWCMILTLALTVYYRFSGLCDIAQGIGFLFGLNLPLNFYYPYQSRSIRDWFDRFNSTVSDFLHRTISRMLQDKEDRPVATAMGMIVVGMLLGLWFGLRINLLLWGAFLALFAVLERYLIGGFLEKLPTLFARMYSFAVVMLSFVLFAGQSPAQSLFYLRNLFGIVTVELYNNQILYLLSTNWMFLFLSCFFATNIINITSITIRKNWPRTGTLLHLAAGLVMVLLTTALLI